MSVCACVNERVTERMSMSLLSVDCKKGLYSGAMSMVISGVSFHCPKCACS